MPFVLRFSTEATSTIARLAGNPASVARHRKVLKALAFLETNPRHPGLHTHVYHEMDGPNGEPVWEAYVENHNPGAWRIWFSYGPNAGQITILAIGPHPD